MNPELIFQQAMPQEAEQIAEFEETCFGEEGFSKNQIKYLIRKAKGEVIVVKKSGVLIGSLILLFRNNSKYLRIYSIAILPEMRGKGIANELIVYAEKKAEELRLKGISLEVNENNMAAVNLYQKAGFRVFQTKKNYYKDKSSALVMRKTIL